MGDSGRRLLSSDDAVVISYNGRHPLRLSLVVFPLVPAIGGKGAVLLKLNTTWLIAANKRLLLVGWHASIGKYYNVIVNNMYPYGIKYL